MWRKYAVTTFICAGAIIAQGCESWVTQTYSIPASAVSGNPVLHEEGQLLGAQAISFDFSGSISKFPGDATLQVLKIRTLLNDSSDATEEALTDSNYMNGCRPNQPSISFLEKIEIEIKRKSDPDSDYVNLATGSYNSDQPCSISLTPNSNLNFANYTSGYSIQVVATGIIPAETVYLGGLITAGWYP